MSFLKWRSFVLLCAILVTGKAIAYSTAILGDVEGDGQKLWSFFKDNPAFNIEGGRVRLKPGHKFVFIGDAVDHGSESLEILQTLVELKESALRAGQPEDVTLIMGNRDINKIRFINELSPEGLAIVPDNLPEYLKTLQERNESWLSQRTKIAGADYLLNDPVVRLSFMLETSMGAANAFQNRRQELERRTPGKAISDIDVVDSMREDVLPGGLEARYLKLAELAHFDRQAKALYVHGAITEENFGVIPDREGPILDAGKWVDSLNAWGKHLITEGLKGSPEVEKLLNYQRPLRGTAENQLSVVYARYSDRLGHPQMISAKLQALLAQNQVFTVISGHTPVGDFPVILASKDGSFRQLLVDNSHSRHRISPHVSLDTGGEIRIEGFLSHDGKRIAVRTSHELGKKGQAIEISTPAGILIADDSEGGQIFFQVASGFKNTYSVKSQRRCEAVLGTLD